MSYEAWRVSFQSSEQAARSAYGEITRLRADLETVTRQRDAILMQARIWSGEAKSQKSIVDQVGAILGGVPDWGPIAAGVENMRADLAASQAECGRLFADVERYWWIRDGSNWPAVFSGSDDTEPLRGVELDTAIDAALAGEVKL